MTPRGSRELDEVNGAMRAIRDLVLTYRRVYPIL